MKTKHWILAILALGALALGACTGDDDDPAPAATPTTDAATSPTAEGTATAEASPSPDSTPSGDLPIEEVPDAYVSETFAPGEAIDRANGAFFMDPATGAIERVGIAGHHDDETTFFGGISDDNQLIAAWGWVLNRATQQAFRYSPEELQLMALGTDTLVFQRLEGSQYTGSLVVTDAAFEVVTTFEGTRDVQALVAPDGSYVVLVEHPTSETPLRVSVLDRAGGEVHEVEGDWTPPEGFVHAYATAQDAGAGMFSLSLAYQEEKPATGTTSRLLLYQYDGALVRELPESAPRQAPQVSPDGTRVAWIESARTREPQAIGGGEIWPSVVVADLASGDILFRARGASLHYGDALLGNRWLADSSAFVAAGRLAGNSLDEGYAPLTEFWLIDRDGEGMTALEGSPYGYDRGPVPSPGDADLVALGRTAVLHLESGEVVEAQVVSGFDTGHTPPWGTDGDELRFTVPHGGHDGGMLTVQALPVRLEEPPFNDALRFVVTGTGDCLNVRTLPDIGYSDTDATPEEGGSEVVACLPDGTIVELTDAPDRPGISLDSTAVMLDYAAGITWLHVRAEDGSEGWVASTYLDWAE